jgi:hypothetical protein
MRPELLNYTDFGFNQLSPRAETSYPYSALLALLDLAMLAHSFRACHKDFVCNRAASAAWFDAEAHCKQPVTATVEIRGERAARRKVVQGILDIRARKTAI